MACLRKGSLVECISNGNVYLKTVQNLQKGDLLIDPTSEGGIGTVENTVFECFSEKTLFSVFGLKCAGPQLVLYNGMWTRAENLLCSRVSIEKNVTLVGVVVRGSCRFRADGVLCRGIRQEEWETILGAFPVKMKS